MFSNVSPSGILVIAIILSVFVFSCVLMFLIYFRYKSMQDQIAKNDGRKAAGGYVQRVRKDFISVYSQNGNNTNTPAIIENAQAVALRGCLMGERFLNNAVSIMVTLGLFGTFLGLTQSVSSLSLLVTQSSAGEWENLLDNVGGGLMSALSGMGVAFYTSLVGVACAIVITILRSVFNPQAQREKLTAMTELWLDHSVAMDIEPEIASDEAMMIKQLRDEIRTAADAMAQSLEGAGRAMSNTMHDMSDEIEKFGQVVSTFNGNVRDFSEFNYNLRHSIELMDVNFYKLAQAMNDTQKTIERVNPYSGGGLKR